jgi:trimethylamine---corrinoid protein Co-methyltransferase
MPAPVNIRAGSGRRRRVQDIVQKPWSNLRNPFPPLNLVSDDEVEAIHRAALDTLEDIGLRCQVKEARDPSRWSPGIRREP